MKELIETANRLREDHTVVDFVEKRINEFEENYNKESVDWFSELCFCILTANSSAKLGIKIQKRIGAEGFLNMPLERLTAILKEEGHRFYRNRAEFIFKARKFDVKVKDIITSFEDKKDAREWLVENVKGLGYKEASHFLRNVGHRNVAILDRHILRILKRYGLITEIPTRLTRRRYLEFEGILEELAEAIGINPGELDLYLWYLETGEVLK